MEKQNIQIEPAKIIEAFQIALAERFRILACLTTTTVVDSISEIRNFDNFFIEEMKSPIDFEYPADKVFGTAANRQQSKTKMTIKKIPHAVFEAVKDSLEKFTSVKILEIAPQRDEISIELNDPNEKIDEIRTEIHEIVAFHKNVLKNEETIFNFCGPIESVIGKGCRTIKTLFGKPALEEHISKSKEIVIPHRKYISKQIVEIEVANDSEIQPKAPEIAPVDNETLFFQLFDDPEEEKDKNVSLECPVCYEDLAYENPDCKKPNYLLCGHCFCKDCLKMHIKDCTAKKNIPIFCPKCREYMALKEIEEILKVGNESEGEEAFMKLKKASTELHFSSNADLYKKCPGADCDNYVACNEFDKQRVVHCEVCCKDYCSVCKTIEHVGKTCEEMEEILNPGWSAYKKANDLKECPKCKISCKKEEGCNHIFCPNCKFHFCYKCCLVFFPTAQECYNHLNQAHGGYYG